MCWMLPGELQSLRRSAWPRDVRVVGRSALWFGLATLLMACGGDVGPTVSPSPSVATATAQANNKPIRIPGQEKVDLIPLSPPATSGFNGLASAPADPSQGDASEATFDRWAFHQIADYWTPLMTRVGLQTRTDVMVTFQPVDATNNPVPCASSDKQDAPGMLDVTVIGPFYCPFNGSGKRVIYWPLQSIFSIGSRTIPSYGEFAEAEVIAHEFGHYIQDITNILGPVKGYIMTDRQAGDNTDAAWWSQDLELQADCMAGAWARHEWDAKLISQNDLNEAATITDAVGDDAINPLALFAPSANAHGTSAQRVKWLNVGLLSGIKCDTWSEPLYAGFLFGQ